MKDKTLNPFSQLLESEPKVEKPSPPEEKVNKDLDKDLSKDLDAHTKQDGSKEGFEPTNQLPPADAVEYMVFRLNKATKVRVNGDLPEDWKKELDEYAHKVGVGKYHLVMYAVGKMLGKV